MKMPWRKKTLTPFRSGDSISVDGSAGPSSDAAGSSAVNASDLFGDPEFDMDLNFRQFCQLDAG